MDCEAILVPVDGSGSSRRAVETAIALARACEARIEYLYVADLKDTLHQAEGRNQHHSVLEMAVEEGRQVLNDVLESTPADVPARGRCVSGDPPQAIMRSLEEDGGDMVVMGTRGLGALEAAFLGSVSSYVLQHAACPVTLVKAEDGDEIFEEF